MQRLFEATERLEAFPRSGRVVPELRREEMREIVLGDYRIVYRLDSETPSILTVFRSSRLLPLGRTDP